MIAQDYGYEDQNDVMNPIDNQEGADEVMLDKIQKLMNEVEIFKQTIQDAKDALASAEMELDEALDTEFSEK